MNATSEHRRYRQLLGAIALAALTACATVTAPPPAASAPVARTAAPSAAQAAAAPYDFDVDVFHPVVGLNGMVASEQ